MDIQGKTSWQHAAGDTNRNYVDLCLQWGVILNGPGDYGPWPDCEELLRKDEWSERKITDLRRFCQDIKDGHLVALRLGTSSIYGVGQIVGEYEHCEEFGDVDGWGLSHVRRVHWLWRYEETPKEFDTYTLKRGDTTQRLHAPAVESWLESVEISDTESEQQLVVLPGTGCYADISVDTISEYLFDRGVASHSVSNLLDQMGELIRIAKWYGRSGEFPSENETISYLVVPLFRALGWTPQRMAIEWNRIDVALFSRLPRANETLSVVVEAKKIRDASLSALSQAEQYAEEYENCGRIVLTDGLRYGVFVRGGGGFSLDAYMNLTNLRDGYPIYRCKGAKDALLAMSPEWDNSG